MTKIVWGLAALALTACATPTPHKIKAKITIYNPREDKYGSRIAMTSKFRAKEGVTVAAEHTIPFGTPIVIPALAGVVGTGKFVVQDRGHDVETRRASRGTLPVFDIYIASRQRYRWCVNHLPPVMEVLLP